MVWNTVTVARNRETVGMPRSCVYCYGRAEQDIKLRTRRERSRTKGRLTTTRIDEQVTIDVPYCRRDAARSGRLRREIRRLGFTAAAISLVLGLLVVVLVLDAPFGVRLVIGVVAGFALGALALLAAGLAVRRLPRYRDWGSGMLGVDLAAGPEALTFRFTNATFASMFRSFNAPAR
jgi:hypothetical protein